MTWGGLAPQQISALDITIQEPDLRNLHLLLLGVLGYFLGAFFWYGAADYSRWTIDLQSTQRLSAEAVGPLMQMLEERGPHHLYPGQDARGQKEWIELAGAAADAKLGTQTLRIWKARAWFEFGIPLAVGAGAVASVLGELVGWTPVGVVIASSLVPLEAWLIRRRMKKPLYGLGRSNRRMERLVTLRERADTLPEGSWRRRYLERRIEKGKKRIFPPRNPVPSS